MPDEEFKIIQKKLKRLKLLKKMEKIGCYITFDFTKYYQSTVRNQSTIVADIVTLITIDCIFWNFNAMIPFHQSV